MAELFVDTSAWYPLADSGHPDHARVADLLAQRIREGARLVTTNFVLAETHALLLRRGGREPALRFLREVRTDPVLVETSTPEIERRAVDEWLGRYQDQDFTLVDAVSFVVMADRGIREALALDRHFATAGFVRLPAN
ncbi:MAG: PIN domain-containing protein [Gemmatimonadota bacterium]|nr:PIN domain-containing protein [Gemmatimonadota bacterium]MDH3423620.1 PIN domain-containing protein [Gemmatimonadota bacterium]